MNNKKKSKKKNHQNKNLFQEKTEITIKILILFELNKLLSLE